MEEESISQFLHGCAHQHGQIPVRVRFYNTSNRFVDLVHSVNDKLNVRYNCIGPSEYETIRTYTGHKWKFFDTENGEEYLCYPDGTTDFYVKPAVHNVFLAINAKNFSLRRCCYESICSGRPIETITPEFIKSLGLPRFLKEDLSNYVKNCIKYQSLYSEKISQIAKNLILELDNLN